MSRRMCTLGVFLLLWAVGGCTDSDDSADSQVLADGLFADDGDNGAKDTSGGDGADTSAVDFTTSTSAMRALTPLVTGEGAVNTADSGWAAILGTDTVLEPIAAAPSVESGPELFLATGVDIATSLIAVSAELNLAWTFQDQGARIHRPAVWIDRLLVITETPSVATAFWLRRADGKVLATVALGKGVATSPARVFSGGSHWLVGVGSRLVGITVVDPLAEDNVELSVSVEKDIAPALVTSVFTTGGWLFGASVWKDGVSLDNNAYGDALYLAGITDNGGPILSFISMGFTNPVSTPDWMWAAPVIVTKLPTCSGPECKPIGDVVFSGGSHWLGGWDVDGGKPLWLLQNLAERITGLAVGDDGTLYSGGSHWLPDNTKTGWTVRGVKTLPDGETYVADEVFSETGNPESIIAGIPSPIVAEGQLHALVVTAEGEMFEQQFSVESTGQHLCGWPRAYGDLANAGMPMTQDWEYCFGE